MPTGSWSNTPNANIIYLTAYDSFAVEAFTQHVSGYLLKPVSQERLQAEVDHALRMRPTGTKPAPSPHVLIRTFGMFDILVVHGIIVFMLVLILMYRRFEKVYIDKAEDKGNQESGLHKLDETSRLALAAAFSMMFTSWFENYFTVPPYSIFFMTFIMMADRRVYHDLLSFRADVV